MLFFKLLGHSLLSLDIEHYRREQLSDSPDAAVLCAAGFEIMRILLPTIIV